MREISLIKMHLYFHVRPVYSHKCIVSYVAHEPVTPHNLCRKMLAITVLEENMGSKIT